MEMLSKALCCILMFSVGYPAVTGYQAPLDVSAEYKQEVSESLNLADEKLKSYYYQLVANNYFDEKYNNQLVLGDVSLATDVQEKGVILLRLIDYLIARNDKTAGLMLQRLNKYFVLKMHRLLAENDLRQERAVRLLVCLDNLYSHKIVTPSGTVAPFRTTLTKMFVVLAMVNDGTPHFGSRKETMLWHMVYKLKHELLEINQQLGEQRLKPAVSGQPDSGEQIIEDFATLLAVYETKQPIIQPNHLKQIVVMTLLFTLSGLVIYWQRENIREYITDPLADWLHKCATAMISAGKEGMEVIGGAVGRGAADEIADRLAKNKKAMQDGAAGALVVAIDRLNNERVKRSKPSSKHKKPRMEWLGGDLAEGVGEGLNKPFRDDELPKCKPGETTHGKRLGEEILSGLDDKAQKIKNSLKDDMPPVKEMAWGWLKSKVFRKPAAQAAPAAPAAAQ